MKKSNKINRIIVLGIIALILSICLVIFILNYSKDDSSFSIIEKNYLSNHSSNVMDVSIYNDVPIYGYSGEGIVFSFLEEFTNSYGIEFNKVSYLKNSTVTLNNLSFRILDYSTSLTENDILMYQDKYVILNKDNVNIDKISDLSNNELLVLDSDVTNVRYFLNDIDVTITSCKDITEMINLSIGSDNVYLVIPYNTYLDVILSNNLKIVYHLDELYMNYVITVNNDNTLRSIMNKYLNIYNETYYEEKYKTYYLDTFFDSMNISEVERMNYYSNPYVYGYVTNMPYENTINKEFVGTISNYLSEFEDMTNVEFKIVGYKNIQELKDAFSKGEVDVLFDNFNLSGINSDVLYTTSPFMEKYVVISKNNYVVNSIRSLKGKNVLTVNNTYLFDYLKTSGIDVNGYDNTDELLRNIASDSIVVMDYDTYLYYQSKKFKDYKIIYEDVISNNYSFAIRDVSKNSTFYNLFLYYISSVNYKNIEYEYNTNYMINSKNEFSYMLKIIAILLGFVFLLVFGLIIVMKIKSKKKDINKDNKLKFIDDMTSLKNRTYLNYNIKTWEDNVIYPQAIVIIDLNNIKYVNDNYGHAEGDEVIKKAASILIINQEANTDIIRTDGNEFLVYMVGYDEKKVIEYTRKISKEMKELPHEFGASIGYSMITDDIKTIDDAINEATLLMRQAKEKL